MLGDLTKLLDVGYLTDVYSFTSDEGEYKFVLKTISPMQESEIYDEVNNKNFKEGSELRFMTLTTYLLAASVQSVNGIDLDKVPGCEGSSSIEKKRSILGKLSAKLLLGLWDKYKELQNKTTLKGDQEEAEQLKK